MAILEMPKIEYVGLPNISKAEKAAVEKNAWRYLGMSKIPERYGTALNLTISRGSKCTNCEKKACSDAIYYAKVAQPNEKFVGGLYSPVLTDISYKLVVIDGLGQLDNVFGPVGVAIFGSSGSETVMVGSTPIYVSGAWANMVTKDALDAIAVFRGNLDGRLKEHANGKRRVGETFEMFRKGLEVQREYDIGAGITLAAGDRAVRAAYDEYIRKAYQCIISDDQELTLQETLQNLENYEFYLTGKIRGV